ncbi:MAG: SDR family NAD(P)-dependent oxidoreductase, partial [Cyanobium sp. PLM2.Bin73]
MTPPVLITGAAGFIGAAVCQRLLEQGERVIGVDNLSPYYDPALKRARLEGLAAAGAHWRFHALDITAGAAVADLFACERPGRVIHLAAQAGVRHSIDNPAAYIQANLVGFASILEAC